MKLGKHSLNSDLNSGFIKPAVLAKKVKLGKSPKAIETNDPDSKTADGTTDSPITESDISVDSGLSAGNVASAGSDASAESGTSDEGGTPTEGEASITGAASEIDGKKNHKSLWIALSSIAGLLIVVYIGMSLYFMSHFGFNTVINDANCSFKTVSQVEDIIKNQVDDYRLEILTRNTMTEYIKGSDIDLVYKADGQIQTLLDEQNEFLWFTRLFGGTKSHTMHATVEFDNAKLTRIIDGLDFMKTDSMIKPVDAYAEFKGTRYVAHTENLGTTIDTTVIYNAIDDAIVNTVETLDLDEAGCYVSPKVTSESRELLDAIALYNTYVPFTLTYTFGETKEVLDATTTFSWLTINKDGTTTLDHEAIAAWVADFAKRHDTVGTKREFMTIDGKPATVTGGTYGWQIDREAEVDAISEMFSDKQSQTREPYYISKASTFGATDWGTTYIELNLSSQHMYYIVNGAIVFESDVVTGLPTAARATPSGVWSILEMQRDRVLRGPLKEDGSFEWEAPVSYWMRVTWSGVGFHDATWQSSFGGSRYLYNGSHGCINMPYYAAQKLYSLISVGTPVVSHY